MVIPLIYGDRKGTTLIYGDRKGTTLIYDKL